MTEELQKHLEWIWLGCMAAELKYQLEKLEKRFYFLQLETGVNVEGTTSPLGASEEGY